MTSAGVGSPARAAHPPRERPRWRDDAGTMTILTTGILVVILMVIGVGVAITSVQLQRNELQSMADGASLAASQAFDEAEIYEPGAATGAVPAVRESRARKAATGYLRDYPPTSGALRDTAISDVDVSDDGTVHVVLASRTDPALIGWVTRRSDLSITIRAAGDARAR